jgi:CheY-like chemotaxis protein
MTRPAKTILLISPNQVTASVIAYQAVIWGYDVTKLHDYSAAAKKLDKNYFDLVLFYAADEPLLWKQLGKAAEQVDAIQRSRHQRTRIVDKMGKLPEGLAQGVDRIVTLVGGSEHLRESIRLAMKRKRGPRPKEIINLKLEAA